jgi:PAS domain S-box-containing protein
MTIIHTYNPYLVALSISVACLASYAALDLGGRIRGSRSRARLAWLATAATAMGGGIWAMHFIGMLALMMPVPVSYDVGLTLLSLIVAIGVTGFGFLMIGTRQVTGPELVLSGIFMGIGIVSMHYTGMAAMRMPADIRYDPILVVLSVLIAIGASIAALWLAFRTTITWQRVLAAIMMGAAISGVHYTGMAAATFMATPGIEVVRGKPALAQTDLALAIATITFVILLLALIASAFDEKMVQRNRELDERNRQLRQANDELMAVYDQGLFASHLNMEGRIVRANRAAVEDLGFARADIIGKPFWEAGWYSAETQEWIRKAFERAAAGTPFRGELSCVLKDGTVRVTDIAFVPIKDEAGRVISVFVPGTDITDRARQYRATFENAGVGIAHLSPEVKWIRVNRTFARIVGYPPDELVSKSVQDITHPDDIESSFAQVERLRSGKADSYELEKRYVRKDGTPVWVHITGTAVRRNDGSVDHFVAVIQDITKRKQHEEREYLLMREINHRAKNLLSVVDAIARQTATRNPEDFVERFSDRIQALSANQDLLVRHEWKGVDIEDLVRAQLAHFRDLFGTRIAIQGPKLRLNPASAQAIGLALHELGTNAGKYGALSSEAGRVDIGWGTNGDTLTMSWTERDGPRVSAPKQRGFGTIVMEMMAERSVGGKVNLSYAPTGVTWHLCCPSANALEPWEHQQFSEKSENRADGAGGKVEVQKRFQARR